MDDARKLSAAEVADIVNGRPELVDRHKFIGASEVAAIVGEDRWTSPLELYLRKVTKQPPGPSSEAAEMGHYLEPVIAQIFADRTGKKVRRRRVGYVEPVDGILRAHLDFLVEGEDEAVECKSVGSRMAHEWDDGPPKRYYLQCHAQMTACPRLKRVHLVALVDRAFVHYVIERCEAVSSALLRAVRVYWTGHVLALVPPPVSSPEEGRSYFDQSDSELVACSVERDSKEFHAFDRMMRARARITKLEKFRDDRVAELMDVMGRAKCGQLVDAATGRSMVKWSYNKAGNRPFTPSRTWRTEE